MRVCTKCAHAQPLEEFPFRGSEPGRTSRCRTCRREAQRDYRRRKPQVGRKRHDAEAWRLSQYGLAQVDYDRLLRDQLGCCAICAARFEKTPHVDHCHVTNKVRGLLCGRCNRGLGMFDDVAKRLRAAACYLERAR